MALGISPTEIVEKGEYKLLAKADHWERVFLADIANVQNGYAFKSEYFDRREGVSLIRIRDISRQETEHRYRGEFDEAYIVTRGNILIGMDGEFFATRWKGKKALLNQRVCRLIFESKGFDERFFFLCLQPFLNAINAETSSVTVKHLSSRTIESVPLPLPPLNEQNRIVAKIEELFSELDKGIESLKTAREQLKVYRQAVLKHAFEGKLTAQWRKENKDKLKTAEQLLARIQKERKARYQRHLEEWKVSIKDWEENRSPRKKPTKPKKILPPEPIAKAELDVLPTLPPVWCYIRLGLLIDKPKYEKSKKCTYEYDGTGVLRIPNVVSGVIDTSDLKFSVFDSSEIEAYNLRQGDILTIRSNGSISIIGKCALISEHDEKYLHAGYLIFLRLNGRLVSSRYLLTVLSSHLLRSQIEVKAKSTSGVNNINSGKIQSLIFPICSMEEQSLIVENISVTLSSIDNTEREIELDLKKSKALRQSILKKAFSDQLVEQDPNDEPASVLLERIKAEKTVRTSARKVVRKRKPRRKEAI